MAERDARIAYVVWEITLRCNLSCSHCGSRAGDARSNELSTEEALDLIQQMADLGVQEVSLIGGEAFLRPDWLQLATAITSSGMRCTMTTGGYGISDRIAAKMAKAGISMVSVSIDGLEETHDTLRGRPGAWRQAMKTMRRLAAVGIPFGCNTQINRRSAAQLPALYEHLRTIGFQSWQLQLTVPMGNAADNHDILLQPAELLELYPMLAELAQRAKLDRVSLQPGNNVGYYGPYARLLRGRGDASHVWSGCKAGVNALGFEADGSIKACPSLPTSAYTGGNIRERTLRDIVYNAPELRFNDEADTDHLWGFCGSCEYAALCRGGCSWTSHVFFDRRGNNPYCHHRALSQAARGLRERTTPEVAASGLPFDNGRFALRTEPLDAPWGADPDRFTLDRVAWPAHWLADEPGLVARLQDERDRSIFAYRRRLLPTEGQALAREANRLYRAGQTAEAEASYRAAITALEAEGSDPEALALSYRDLSGLMLREFRHEAAPFALRGAELLAELAPDSLDYVEALNNLAALGKLNRDPAYAEANYRAAIAVLDRIDPQIERSTRAAVLLNFLSEMMRRQGRYWEAQAPLDRAMDIYTRVYDPEHPERQKLTEVYNHYYGPQAAGPSAAV